MPLKDLEFERDGHADMYDRGFGRSSCNPLIVLASYNPLSTNCGPLVYKLCEDDPNNPQPFCFYDIAMATTLEQPLFGLLKAGTCT